MVFNRILFNNIKEYTPHWIRTLPTKGATRTPFVTRPTNSYSAGRKSLYKAWKFLFQGVVGFQNFVFLSCFGLTALVFTPALAIYRSNNTHRTLDAALEIEKAYKKKKAEEEAAEEAAAAAAEEKEQSEESQKDDKDDKEDKEENSEDSE